MKTKRLLSWLISGSLMASVLPMSAVSAADEAEYSSVTVNLAEAKLLNYDRAFYKGDGGSSKFYDGKIGPEIEFEGSTIRHDAAAINTEAFVAYSDKNAADGVTAYWKNDWADIATVDYGKTMGWASGEITTAGKTNILSMNGIDYEILVPHRSGEWYLGTGSGSAIKTESFGAGSDETGYSFQIDLPDGYYNGITFLGASNAGTQYVRYIYEDDTKSNWSKLSDECGFTTENPTNPKYIEVTANTWNSSKYNKDTLPTLQTNKIKLYQINDVTADASKKITAIELLKRNGAVKDTNENGILDDEAVVGSSGWGQRFNFIGMSMLVSKILEVKTILNTLPPAKLFEATSENIELLNRLATLLDEIDYSSLEGEELKIYDDAVAYTQYEFETGYASVTQNIVDLGFANFGRAYTTGGGSYVYYTGTTYYSISGEGLIAESGWKNKWQDIELEGTKDAFGYKDNILTFNGVDYEITIPFNRADGKVYTSTEFNDMVKTENFAGNADEGYYQTYDITDGYYKGISFLGGSMANNPYIRYVYSDNTKSDWSQLDYVKNNVTAPAEGQYALNVDANKWTYANSATSDLTVEKDGFYLHQMQNENADINKKTVAVEIIARNGTLPKVDGVVDVTAEPVASTNNWGYRLYVIGMTMLTNNAGKSNAACDKMKEIVAALPGTDKIDGTNNADLELIIELEAVLEDVIPETLSEADLAIYNEAVEYVKVADLIKDEYVTVEPSRFVNSPNAYWIDGTAANQGNAFSGTAIYAPDFKAMKIWENEWTDDLTENVLTFNGYKYKLKVTDEKGINVTVSAKQATSTDDAYIRVPVEAGYYNALSLLGGLEYNGTAGAVRLNYADGTNSGFINIDGIQKMNTGDGLKVTRYIFDKTTSTYVANDNITLHQYNVPADASKLLSSFDLIARNAVVENGVVTSVEDSLRTYNTRWFGFGLKTNGILADNAKDVNVAVNPDIFVNYNRTYMKTCGNAGISNNHSINWEEFIKLSNWKNTWSDGTGVEDNVFVTDNAEYIVRMDRGVQKNNTFAAQSGTEVGYTTIDVSDGYFTKMMLLGGATQHGATTIAAQFNYSDGTVSGFITLPSGGNILASGNNAIEVKGIKSTQAADKTFTYEDINLYLREYELVNPNPYKKVVSVSIPYRNVTIANGVLTPMSITGGSGAYAYDNRFIGMTMVTNKALQKFEVVDDSKDPISIMVSAEGSDDNNGVSAPVKTLSMAITKAKAINSISTYDRDVLITLADGEYEVAETISIDSFRGKVTIKAEEGTNPVIKGSKTVNVSDMADYANGIKTVDLKAYGITSIKDDSIISSNNSIYATNNFGVYSEGEILPIAEYPNNGELVEEAAINTKAGDTIIISNDVFVDFEGDENIYIEGYLVENYRTYKTNSIMIAGTDLMVDPAKIPARTMYGLTRNWRIFNSLALLDAEGEWYLDKATMTLYYMPKSGETSVEISNMTDTLIKVLIDDVTIDGIAFENTCGNAIEASDVDNVTITNSSFEAIGKNAITASDVNNALISENEITNIGYRGISISGGDVKTLTESGNVVEENTIQRPGRIVSCYSPAVNVSGVGNVIKNNYISESKSILVSVAGSLNKIMYNDILNAGMEAKDLGAVYGGRNLTYLGNEIAYNHIVNHVREEATDDVVAGVYLDDGMSGTKVYNNIIENADRGVFANGGSQNTINNNVLVNCKRGIVTGANPITGFTMDYDSNNKEVSLTKYAELFFAANPAYEDKFDDLDLTKLTVDVADFKASAVVSGNRFKGCDSNWDNAAYKNGTEYDTSDDVYAEVTGDDNVTFTETLKAYAEADIDTNDIGLAKDGLDTEIAWAEIKNGTITVNYVSTYNDYKVMAAVKDSTGKLLAVKSVTDGESFTVQNAADVDIFVFDSLENIKPMTK